MSVREDEVDPMGVDETEDAWEGPREGQSKVWKGGRAKGQVKDSQGDENYEWLIIEAHRSEII